MKGGTAPGKGGTLPRVPGGSRQRRGRAIRIALLAGASAGICGLSAPEKAAPVHLADRFDRVVLDAGHGGEDHGARGPEGALEKEVALDVALRVADLLRGAGLEVVLTRSDDTFVPLERRTEIANRADGDLFVSIHCNGARSRSARGIETFFLSAEASDEAARNLARRENLAFGPEGGESGPAGGLAALLLDLIATEHLQESAEFARLAQAALTAREQGWSRGLKQAPFVVLMNLDMPAALLEIGFLTHPEEGRELARAERRQEIAQAIVRAILEFGRRYDARRGVADADVAAGGGGR